MNRLLIFLLSVAFALSGIAQDTVNQTDASGRKQGYWIRKDTAGHTIYQGRFIDGSPVGTFTYYYPGGKIKAVSRFSEEGKRAQTTTYFPGGKKNAQGSYYLEKREGMWKFFSEYDESLVAEEFYKNGVKDGTEKTYYHGKGILELITWKSGVREGPWEQYFDDGSLKLHCSYKKDLKEGPLTVYYPTGQKYSTGAYLEGFPHGTWLTFDLEGKTVITEEYNHGVLVKTTKQPEPAPKEIPVKEE